MQAIHAGAHERVLSFPIAVIPAPASFDPRGALLDELDSHIADLGAALALRDEYARQVEVTREKIALCRAALGGQVTMELTR